jgi:hypothetical protein
MKLSLRGKISIENPCLLSIEAAVLIVIAHLNYLQGLIFKLAVELKFMQRGKSKHFCYLKPIF